MTDGTKMYNFSTLQNDDVTICIDGLRVRAVLVVGLTYARFWVNTDGIQDYFNRDFNGLCGDWCSTASARPTHSLLLTHGYDGLFNSEVVVNTLECERFEGSVTLPRILSQAGIVMSRVDKGYQLTYPTLAYEQRLFDPQIFALDDADLSLNLTKTLKDLLHCHTLTGANLNDYILCVLAKFRHDLYQGSRCAGWAVAVESLRHNKEIFDSIRMYGIKTQKDESTLVLAKSSNEHGTVKVYLGFHEDTGPTMVVESMSSESPEIIYCSLDEIWNSNLTVLSSDMIADKAATLGIELSAEEMEQINTNRTTKDELQTKSK